MLVYESSNFTLTNPEVDVALANDSVISNAYDAFARLSRNQELDTVESLINSYAQPHENATDHYIHMFAKH